MTDQAERLDGRPFEELRDSGLLWLINRSVFHPRGYALGIVFRDEQAVGWSLFGDGSEPWLFDGDEQADFRQAKETLRSGSTDSPSDQ